MTARSGGRFLAGAFGFAALVAAAEAPAACAEEGRVLRVGFFPDFAPVSYSADRDPAAPASTNTTATKRTF